jgi:hypothetical protein
MFVQTEITPNPNSLKFIPGKTVSNSGSFEITKKEEIDNELVRNLLSINGVTGIFLGADFISVNKEQDINWEEIKHIVISLINEHYQSGKKFVIDKSINETPSEENCRLLWQRMQAILRTQKRLVLVLPQYIEGKEQLPHPLWGDLCAALGEDDLGQIIVNFAYTIF